jgi:hypothetical protein
MISVKHLTGRFGRIGQLFPGIPHEGKLSKSPAERVQSVHCVHGLDDREHVGNAKLRACSQSRGLSSRARGGLVCVPFQACLLPLLEFAPDLRPVSVREPPNLRAKDTSLAR